MIPVFPSSNPMTLELLARPAAEVCGGIVCRLEKIHQRVLGRTQLPHRFIRQHEFTELIVVVRLAAPDGSLPEPLGLRIAVGVVRRIESCSALPESSAGDFV